MKNETDQKWFETSTVAINYPLIRKISSIPQSLMLTQESSKSRRGGGIRLKGKRDTGTLQLPCCASFDVISCDFLYVYYYLGL